MQADSVRPLRVIGYVRVSTEEQGRDGHGLRGQIDVLARWCAAQGYDLVTVIPDVVSTRRTHQMLGRALAIALVEAGAGDALGIRALDRVTRSVQDGAALLQSCGEAGVRILSCDGYDSADEETQLTANIKIAVAQEERRLISRRTREALARAQANGVVLGRVSTVSQDVSDRIVAERAKGNSYQLIAEGLDAAGVETPGISTKWRAATVRDLYTRALRTLDGAQ
jgi:DNA invertase Pin-like site-specific DNA recombinase